MKYCGNCGIELKDEDKFCPNCATEYIEYNPEIEKIQMQEELDIKKRKKKKIKLTILGAVIIAIAAIGVSVATQYDDLVASYNEAVDDIEKMNQETTQESGKNTTNSFEESTQEAATEENTTIQNETIELLDLFDSLETAKQILGEESSSGTIDERTQYKFNDISIIYRNDIDFIESMEIDFSTDEKRTKYTFMGYDGNYHADWENSTGFGELIYTGINQNSDIVYDYEKTIGNYTYCTEIIVGSDNKILEMHIERWEIE